MFRRCVCRPAGHGVRRKFHEAAKLCDSRLEPLVSVSWCENSTPARCRAHLPLRPRISTVGRRWGSSHPSVCDWAVARSPSKPSLCPHVVVEDAAAEAEVWAPVTSWQLRLHCPVGCVSGRLRARPKRITHDERLRRWGCRSAASPSPSFLGLKGLHLALIPMRPSAVETRLVSEPLFSL